MSAAAVGRSSVRELLEHATRQLVASDSATLDAQLLLAEVLGKSRTWLHAWPDAEPGAEVVARFAALLARRVAGEPVAYILGHREFWSLELEVGPAVLIPRPETELLVEIALELSVAAQARVADLGTGSGAVALALARERRDWELYATDLSAAALDVARRNAARLGFANIGFLLGNWCEPLPELPFDIVLSNPPYIAESDAHLRQGDLRFEPRSALVAGEGGLQDIRQLAVQAVTRLRTGGWLLVEHGWEQGPAVRQLLQGAGYTDIATRRDAGGQERVTLGRRP